MSIRLMTTVWDRFPASGSELLVMLALADWANDTGGSLHPSINALAKKIRVSESQARRILHKLMEDGFLSVVGNLAGGAPGMTRRYQINVAKLNALPEAGETGSADATGCTSATGRIGARDGSHGCAETGVIGDTQTTNRTTIEPPDKSLGASAPTDDGITDLAKPPVKPAKPKPAPVDELFERAWEMYPARHGGNPKRDALHAWNARVREGIDPSALIEGVDRYAKFCRADGKIGTPYVMQAATFFGPSQRFAEEWPCLPSRHGRPSINDIPAPGDAPDDVFGQLSTTLP